MSRRYGIIGTGAIGGFYGAHLQRVGHEVHFLLRSDYHHVKEKGLEVESPDGNFTLPKVYAYNSPTAMPTCDVVILALKTTQNHLLPKLLPPLIQENTVVLVLQNGLGIEAEVAEVVGSQPIIGGLCFICSHKVAPGKIRHLDYKKITLGAYSPDYQPQGITPQMQEIARDFAATVIPINRQEDLLQSRWDKLVWNIPYNGLSVVLDATTNEMMANSQTRSLIEEIMQEVALGAKSQQRLISDEFIEKMLTSTEKMQPYTTSMKLDYDRKRPLELKAIFENPLQTALNMGVDLPRIRMLYQQLQFLNLQNLA